MPQICVIFAAGDCNGTVTIPDNAFIIAADGGLEHTDARGITPDLIIGDFDSYDETAVKREHITVPVKKDETDLYLAMREGYARGFRVFVVYGALGGKRLSHTVANIAHTALFTQKGCRVKLMSDTGQVTALYTDGSSPASLSFPAANSGYVSLFAFGGKAEGVTLENLLYPLSDGVLEPSFPLGVSNEFTGKEARVILKRGTLIIITEENDHHEKA